MASSSRSTRRVRSLSSQETASVKVYLNGQFLESAEVRAVSEQRVARALRFHGDRGASRGTHGLTVGRQVARDVVSA